MVTITKIGEEYNSQILEISGLSTDPKPVDKIDGVSIANGSTFKEIDTGKEYTYNESAETWHVNKTASSSGGSGVDGEDGITPHIGENGNWFIGTVDTGVPAQGPAGENGVTPHIGTNGNWYIGSTNTGVSAKGVKGDTGEPGAKGDKGDTGAQGEPGKDGSDGKDGISATHSWNGTVLSITSASGTSSVDLKGEKGDTGAKGDVGSQGEKGDPGATGPKGDTGAKGDDGADGGHYTPIVTQPTSDTMQISFTPSKSDMPAVNPVTVNLPVSENSGENLDYSAATNKPSINGVTLEGNKTSAELGIGQPSDEQVGNAVSAYLDEHPVAAGATEEQVEQIQANTRSADVLNTVLQNSVLYAWPGLADERVPKYEGYTVAVSVSTGAFARRAVTGHRYMLNNSIILRQGDMLITNADCAADAPNQYTPVLLKKGDKFTTAYNAGTPVAYGRAAFDGQYITYTATDPVEYIQISWKADVDYAVKVYVAAARADEVTIPVTYAPGYLKATTGAPTSVGDGTTLYPSGYCTEQMTDLITVSAPGKFLLVKNVTLNSVAGGFRSEYPWCRYAEDGTLLYAHHKDRWDLSKNYYVIPLLEQTEYIRFAFTAAANPLERLEALLVDREYLIRNGYGLHTYGKSMTAFGDSYIGEWSGSISGVKILAWKNLMAYTPFGHNGWGIAASPNYAGGLVENVETELGSTDTDYYIIQAGRNDYNCQTPIGTNEDMHGPDVLYTQRSFKGALNWLCQWLVQNKPTKKVIFFTPWFFPGRTTSGDDQGAGTGSEFVETHKPVEYIDAIIEIAGRWGIPVLDCARNAGMHVRDEAFRTAYYRSADDVSHLNADGAALFANNVQRLFEVL